MPPSRRDTLKVLATLALGGCASKPTYVTPQALPSAAQTRNASVNSRPLMKLRLSTSPTLNVGDTPQGPLTIYPVIGGTFEGERLRGKVLSGGADWVTKGADGVLRLELRVTLQTDDGALIDMTFTGIRDDANHYFRTLPRFETASPKYAFLNRLVSVGVGEISPDGPVHVIEEIL